MTNEERLLDLKKGYEFVISKGEEFQQIFLDGVVGTCKFSKMTLEQTKKMIELVCNVMPIKFDNWRECRSFSPLEIDFIKKLEESWYGEK